MAAASEMTMSIARGKRERALTIFQTAWAMVLASSACFCAIAFIVISELPTTVFPTTEGLDGSEVRTALFFLIGYALISMQSGMFLAGYRSNNLYALGTFVFMFVLLAEGLALLIIALLGGNILTASIAVLAGRFLGVSALSIILGSKVPWLRFGFTHISRKHARRLLRPAIAVTTLPLAYASVLQGTVLVVGFALSAHAVAVFSTVRTLTRLGVQMMALVNLSTMPEFSLAAGQEDDQRKTDIVLINLVSVAAFMLPAAVFLMIFGPWIISFWTKGAIFAPTELIAAMTIVMVLNGFWQPIANLVLAINRQSEYAYVYLAASVCSVALSYYAIAAIGLLGAACSLVLLEAFMIVHVYRIAIRMRVLDFRLLFLRFTEKRQHWYLRYCERMQRNR